MFRATFVLASLAASVLAFPPLARASVIGPTWGGGGGGGYLIQCAGTATPWMSGATVRRGDVIDIMAVNCTDTAGHNGQSAFVGGSGGTKTEFQVCPNNEVVTGAIAFSAQYFNGAYLLCNKLANQRVGNFSAEHFLGRFGTGGNVNAVFRCPSGTAASGFIGGSGIFVDRAAFVCLDIP